MVTFFIYRCKIEVMEYEEIKKEILEEMRIDLLSIYTKDEKQKLIAERAYLLGLLIKAKIKLNDQSVLIKSLRK